MIDRREMITGTALALGYALGPTGLTSLLSGSVEAADITVNNAKAYKFFSAAQAKTVEALADLILPKTETPGAIEVGALGFIDRFVSNVFSEQDQKTFAAGLDQFIADVQKSGKSFEQLPEADQVAELKKLETKTFESKASGSKDAVFYKKFKMLLITGYYQSEKIAEEVLAYDPIPGKFKGDIAYSGKDWSVLK